MITVTEKAVGEIKRVMSDQKFPETTFLRIGIAAGGCSGFQYSLGFDDKYDAAKDQMVDQHGLKIVVDKKSDLYLDGATLDFSDDINARGFRFSNPHEAKGCGCGKSFSV